MFPRFYLLVSLFCCLLNTGSVISRCEAAGLDNPWTHSFYFENDLFNNTDSQYTNGVKYSIISPDLSPSARDYDQIPRYILDWVHRIPFIKKAPPETAHKVEFSLGQNIFTPADIRRTDLVEDDRPYAGWLYVSSALHRKSREGQSLSQMDTLEAQGGIVGSYSLAENAQNFVHRLRDIDEALGWNNQLDNELGVLLAYERKWLYHPGFEGWSYDLLSHAGGAVGNVATYLNGGFQVRAGWNVPRSFGARLIRPAGSAWLPREGGFRFYAFSAIDARYVMHSIFLDGNTFTGSHSVDRRPFVADMLVGVTLGFDRFSLSFTQNHRTREFEEQREDHNFGSIRLTFSALF